MKEILQAGFDARGLSLFVALFDQPGSLVRGRAGRQRALALALGMTNLRCVEWEAMQTTVHVPSDLADHLAAEAALTG